MVPSLQTVMYAPAFESQQQQSIASVSAPTQTVPPMQDDVREEEKRERLRYGKGREKRGIGKSL